MGKPLAHNLSIVTVTRYYPGASAEETKKVTSYASAKGRTETALAIKRHMSTTDHVYNVTVSESSPMISKEHELGRSARSPGRGGNCVKLCCHETGEALLKSVDSMAAILDNLRNEELTDTTNDTSAGAYKVDGVHAMTLDWKEVTRHRTEYVEDGDTTASVGKGYEDH